MKYAYISNLDIYIYFLVSDIFVSKIKLKTKDLNFKRDQ